MTYINNLSEAPQEVQERLAKERLELHTKNYNGAYRVTLYNAEGTRYFSASRVCESWSDNKGHYMPFGGGTHWNVSYGAVQFRNVRNPIGEWEQELMNGKRYGSITKEDGVRVEIPNRLHTKREVIALAKSIGKFDI